MRSRSGPFGLLLVLVLLGGCAGQGNPAGTTGPPPTAPAAQAAATTAPAKPTEAPKPAATTAPAPATAGPATIVPAATTAPTAAPKPAAATQPAAPAGPTAAPPAAPTAAPAAADLGLGGRRLALERVVGDLQGPTHITHAGDGSGRLFVVEKPGRIRIVKGGDLLAEPFLDIVTLVNARSSERGLLGVAFHPQYASNGLFFVNYSDENGDTVVARYSVGSANPDRADPASAKQVLFFKQPFPNHNGGLVLFGPDGYLWIGTGDGGSGGDPQGNGQRTDTLLGKMLRIDVDRDDPYAIPADNPYQGVAGARPEIWSIGLRNPWRYSFDRATGDLYIADVGQNQWEEIHVTPAGSTGKVNYGWNLMEGRHCFRPAQGCAQTGLDLPPVEYGRDQGCSITGGHVYRGGRHAGLQGVYIYGDFCQGRIWGMARQGDRWASAELLRSSYQISSFGEDQAGEVYLASYGTGEVYRLTLGG